MKMILYFAPLLCFSVAVLIRAELKENKSVIFIVKPLSTLIVIVTALLSFGDPMWNPTYSYGITAGLTFSLGGDIALMFKDKKKSFMIGLAFFLTAHVIYTVVFCLLGRFSAWDIGTGAILTAAAVGIYRIIRKNLGSMRAPVIAYMVIISLMVSRAVSTFAGPLLTEFQASLIATGAWLFYVSDVILAANRFWKQWRWNRISLAFYYSGQFLLALAASYFVR